MRSAIIIAAVIASGCVHTLDWQLPREALVAPAPADYPEAEAVILHLESNYLLKSSWRSTSHLEYQNHVVIAILTEDGVNYADVRVPYPADGKIQNFFARTITADGRTREVEPTRIFDAEARKSEVDPHLDMKVRTFSLPKVRPGTVIEYKYTVRVPSLGNWYRQFMSRNIPVKKYRISIEGTKDIRYAANAYNSNLKWQVEKKRKTWVLSAEVSDIPARDHGFAVPHRELTEPWWLFRTQQYVRGGSAYDRHRTWDSTMAWRANDLYFDGDDFQEDFPFALETDANDTKEEILEKALVFLRQELPMRSFGRMSGRDAIKIRDTGDATGVEKARVLHRLLKDAGVQADFAFADRYLHENNDRDTPWHLDLPHLVLWVPVQPGLKTGRWVDPSCEYCNLGELPFWLTDAEALVIQATKGALDRKPKVQSQFRKIEGIAQGEEVDYRRYEVDVDAAGKLKALAQLGGRNRRAQDRRGLWRKRGNEDWENAFDNAVTNRIPTATRTRAEAPTINDQLTDASYKVGFEATGFGIVTDDAVMVPLTFFRSGWDTRLKRKDRRAGYAFIYPWTTDETAVVRGPSGMVPVAWPESTEIKTPMLSVQVHTRRVGDAIHVTRRVRANAGLHAEIDRAEARAALEVFASVRDAMIRFAPAGQDRPPAANAATNAFMGGIEKRR